MNVQALLYAERWQNRSPQSDHRASASHRGKSRLKSDWNNKDKLTAELIKFQNKVIIKMTRNPSQSQNETKLKSK